jgi:hypothetical protein
VFLGAVTAVGVAVCGHVCYLSSCQREEPEDDCGDGDDGKLGRIIGSLNNLPRTGGGKPGQAGRGRGAWDGSSPLVPPRAHDAEAIAGMLSIRPPPPSQLPPARRSRRREAHVTATSPLVVKRPSGGVAADTGDLSFSSGGGGENKMTRFELYKRQKEKLASSQSRNGSEPAAGGQQDLMRSQPIRSAAATSALRHSPSSSMAGAVGLAVASDHGTNVIQQKSGRSRQSIPSQSSAMRSHSTDRTHSLVSALGVSPDNSQGSQNSALVQPRASRESSSSRSTYS